MKPQFKPRRRRKPGGCGTTIEALMRKAGACGSVFGETMKKREWWIGCSAGDASTGRQRKHPSSDGALDPPVAQAGALHHGEPNEYRITSHWNEGAPPAVWRRRR